MFCAVSETTRRVVAERALRDLNETLERRVNEALAEHGARIGAYQFVYDVTDRVRDQERLRKAEEALRQSQKLEAIG